MVIYQSGLTGEGREGGRGGLSKRSGRVEYNQESIIIGYTPCTFYLWILKIAGRGRKGGEERDRERWRRLRGRAVR